ncbi:MAG: FAD-dependent thymidylate synthase [Candidatus Aenigmatarchaeota archaeon]
MRVKLLAFTPDPELVVAASATTSFKKKPTSFTFEKYKKEMPKEKIKNIIRDLLRHNHLSPLEHASFTFSLEEVSRSLTHELVRHRIASYTQQSQRYVKVDTKEEWFVIPPKLEGENRKKFIERMKQIAAWYEEFIKEGISYEDARFILPNATKTNIVVTMNARELYHFFNLRCCARAQWEIRNAATEMLKIVKKIAPTLFEKAGPSCMKGFCPEGELMPEECRKTGIQEIQKRFMELG